MIKIKDFTVPSNIIVRWRLPYTSPAQACNASGVDFNNTYPYLVHNHQTMNF